MILGLDPGTTVGWALLDFSGKIVRVYSERNLDLNSLITKLIPYKILFVGCDKSKAPSFVQDAARKLGARVVAPSSDLRVSEKRNLKGFIVANSHERDALASALFAYRQVEPLIGRAKRFLEKEGRLSLFNDVLEIVVKDQISIKHSFQLLASPDFKPVAKKSREYELDFKKMYAALVDTRSQYRELLQNYSLLAGEHNRLKQNHNHIKQKLSGMVKPKSKNAVKEQYSKKLSYLNRQVSEQKKVIRVLAAKLKLLEKSFISGNRVALPKLKRLSWRAVQNSDLPFFVEEGSEFSKKAVELLADREVSFVIFKNPPGRRLQKKLPFSCIRAENFVELENIILVDKRWLEQLRKKPEVLNKVLKEYKKSRSADKLV